MAFLRLAVLVIVVALASSAAVPADKDSARQAETVQNTKATPEPKPQECTLFVGTKEQKMKPGCQICWAPPEYITCKNGDWDFGTCGSDDMKCVHTSECTTTCVKKPPTTKAPTAAPIVTEPPPVKNATSA